MTMYFGGKIKIPETGGKIYIRKIKGTFYVYYEYSRTKLTTGNTNPKRVIIGKRDPDDETMMQPNDRFVQYFPDVELPMEKKDINPKRSCCLQAGTWYVIRHILLESGVDDLLKKYFKPSVVGLIEDFCAYSITEASNVAQHYPDYAYCHPLFTKNMKIYSDSSLSNLWGSMTEESMTGFINDWNKKHTEKDKIYISYDSTNKNSEAGDISFVEFGKPKVDVGEGIFNYSIAYDSKNQDPLFYEYYPGSINDISQCQMMLDKAHAFGYQGIGFILDRGYFSKDNLYTMDHYHYSFIIMMKGKKDLVRGFVSDKKGTFETDWDCFNQRFGVYGTSCEGKLFATDDKNRYFHIYFSEEKMVAERRAVESHIRELQKFLNKQVEKKSKAKFDKGDYARYFDCHYDKDGILTGVIRKKEAISEALEYCGYFCIVTSEKMTANEALALYKSRDGSEKLFREDKTYLGDKSMRVYSDEAVESKIFNEFIALIIRNRMYTALKEERCKMESRPNYMTVPAAIGELNKIELCRQADGVYRLDHAVTKCQKTILNAFGMNGGTIRALATETGTQLKEYDKDTGAADDENDDKEPDSADDM